MVELPHCRNTFKQNYSYKGEIEMSPDSTSVHNLANNDYSICLIRFTRFTMRLTADLI